MMGVEGDGRLREGGWWMEWSEKMPRITQNSNQSWEMDGFAQKAWRSFLVK